MHSVYWLVESQIVFIRFLMYVDSYIMLIACCVISLVPVKLQEVVIIIILCMHIQPFFVFWFGAG